MLEDSVHIDPHPATILGVGDQNCVSHNFGIRAPTRAGATEGRRLQVMRLH